jgi:hypothetical protein
MQLPKEVKSGFSEQAVKLIVAASRMERWSLSDRREQNDT